MKICFVSQNACPGFSIFRKDLIKYLVKERHQVFAFAIDYTDESRRIVSELGAIPIDYCLDKSGINPFLDLKHMWLLSKLFKKIQPDVIFSFFIKPSLYGTLAGKLAKVPRRIAMLEGLGYMYTPLRDGFSFEKRCLQYVHGFLVSVCYVFANQVLFLNKDDMSDLRNSSFIDSKKCKVVGPIGLDLLTYDYKQTVIRGPIRFIFVGRLLLEKGIYEYLAAARIVKSSFPEVEFVVLGALDSDNPASLLQKELDDILDENIIIYPGYVSNVTEWISTSHVFVLPSYREGFPRATQEAMAMGRAVITTDVPGCRDTVQDGDNGFLTPLYDVQTLAEKMIYLVKNPQEIIRMGNKSYRIALDTFDVHKINPVLTKVIIGD